MRAIWKYEVEVNDRTAVLRMPLGARIVHVAAPSPYRVWFWAEIARPGLSDAYTELRTFQVVGTGMGVPDEWTYRGTAPTELGLVWHLMELPEGAA